MQHPGRADDIEEASLRVERAGRVDPVRAAVPVRADGAERAVPQHGAVRLQGIRVSRRRCCEDDESLAGHGRRDGRRDDAAVERSQAILNPFTLAVYAAAGVNASICASCPKDVHDPSGEIAESLVDARATATRTATTKAGVAFARRKC
jgi:hypothetical protein